MLVFLLSLSSLGIILSSYLLYVEHKLKQDQSHKAICDINEKISCTAVAKSKYANIFFGFSNALIGLGFYVLILILAILNLPNFINALSSVAILFTLYLIYRLYKIKKVCIVCIATYIINFLIFGFSIS